MSSRMENIGHGWVRPRADGAKAKCGGPGICRECQREKADLDKMSELERVCWACLAVYTGPLGVSGKCPTCEAGGQPDPLLDVSAPSQRGALWNRANAVEVPNGLESFPGDTVSCFLIVSDGVNIGSARWHYPTKSWCGRAPDETFNIVFWSRVPSWRTVNEAMALAPQWRCFHCDEVFTDRAAAADHFGVQIDGCADDVACKLNATEGLLVKMLREAQEELRQYHQEDNESFRQFYSLGSEHAVALRREEERGYARGLEDAKKHPETLGLARVAT